MNQPSPKYKLNRTDLKESSKVLLYMVAMSVLTAVAQWAADTDFGDATEFVMAAIGGLVYLGKRWIQEQKGN